MASKKRKPARVRPSTTSMVPEYVRGNAFRGAYKKGIEARAKGKTTRANPYDRRAPMPTPQRGLWNYWLMGWHSEDNRRTALHPPAVRARG